MAGFKVITEPEEEPVTVEQAKLSARVGDDAEEDLIELWIEEGRRYVENVTHRALVTQKLRLTLDCWPARVIYLPRPPLQAVTAVKYVDSSGVEQTLTEGTHFEVDDSGHEPAFIRPLFGLVWPWHKIQLGAITIEYTAGYGTAEDVPAGARHAILLHVGNAYAHRETIGTGTVTYELAQTIKTVLGNAGLLRPSADEEAF